MASAFVAGRGTLCFGDFRRMGKESLCVCVEMISDALQVGNSNGHRIE